MKLPNLKNKYHEIELRFYNGVNQILESEYENIVKSKLICDLYKDVRKRTQKVIEWNLKNLGHK